MLSYIFILSFATLVVTSVLPSTDPPFQSVPAKATTPDNNFNIGTTLFQGQPADNDNAIVNAAYGPRSVDIPFALLNHGNLKFFGANQLNQPGATTDQWHPGQNDHASQSACGIPDNAFEPSKVAIHPYWLKYAPRDMTKPDHPSLGLSRFCMQDVCISIWNDNDDNNGSGDDVELKVTDICSTNPADATYCATPADIKIDRIKADLLYSNVKNKTRAENEELAVGNGYDRKVYWFFSKCWDDGLPQPAYNTTKNWFANPPLPNSSKWSKDTLTRQYLNNQASYPALGLPVYKNGAYTAGTHRERAVFDIGGDWKVGDKVPDWCPVAGGRGNGQPTGHCS